MFQEAHGYFPSKYFFYNSPNILEATQPNRRFYLHRQTPTIPKRLFRSVIPVHHCGVFDWYDALNSYLCQDFATFHHGLESYLHSWLSLTKLTIFMKHVLSNSRILSIRCVLLSQFPTNHWAARPVRAIWPSQTQQQITSICSEPTSARTYSYTICRFSPTKSIKIRSLKMYI